MGPERGPSVPSQRIKSSSVGNATSWAASLAMRHELLNVLRENIHFNVYPGTWAVRSQRCVLESVRDDRKADEIVFDLGNGQTDPVYGHRTFAHDIAREFPRYKN